MLLSLNEFLQIMPVTLHGDDSRASWAPGVHDNRPTETRVIEGDGSWDGGDGDVDLLRIVCVKPVPLLMSGDRTPIAGSFQIR